MKFFTKKRIIIFVILLVIVNVFLVVKNHNTGYIKYDREHNKYSFYESIVFYNPDGERFKVNHEKYILYSIDSDKTINGDNAWVNKEGYLVEINGKEIDFDDSKPLKEPYCYCDKEGNYYASPFVSYWDKDGNLTVFYIEKKELLSGSSFLQYIE